MVNDKEFIFDPESDEVQYIPEWVTIFSKKKKKKKKKQEPKEEWPTLGGERMKRRKSGEPTGSAWGVYE